MHLWMVGVYVHMATCTHDGLAEGRELCDSAASATMQPHSAPASTAAATVTTRCCHLHIKCQVSVLEAHVDDDTKAEWGGGGEHLGGHLLCDRCYHLHLCASGSTLTTLLYYTATHTDCINTSSRHPPTPRHHPQPNHPHAVLPGTKTQHDIHLCRVHLPCVLYNLSGCLTVC